MLVDATVGDTIRAPTCHDPAVIGDYFTWQLDKEKLHQDSLDPSNLRLHAFSSHELASAR